MSESDRQELINLLKSKCNDAFTAFLTNKRSIFRGTSDKFGGFVIQAEYRLGVRRAENTADFYRMLLDHDISQKGKNYPLRSASMVCSTNYDYAAGYGNTVFNVFPFDDAIIGVVPDHDIFDRTVTCPLLFWAQGEAENPFNLTHSVDDISIYLREMFSFFNIAAGKSINHDFFVDALKQIGFEQFREFVIDRVTYNRKTRGQYINDKEFKKKNEFYADKILEGIKVSSIEDVINYFENLVTVESLGLKFEKTSEFFKDSHNFYNADGNECWIGDKCILVDSRVAEELFNRSPELS
jgi:hypothetical protein